MSNTLPEVDTYIANAPRWHAELARLRELVLQSELQEAFKWRTPCYTLNDKNVVILNSMKNYCCLGFFKGALLNDAQGLLEKQGANSQAVRILRFESLDQINARGELIIDYIAEAIAIEQAKLTVPKPMQAVPVPHELRDAFRADSALQQAFEALTPGRQRAYLLHFNDAKQAKTRSARIERVTPLIMAGKGMTDCTCGLSRKPPRCDGSHRQLPTGKRPIP